MLTAQGLKSVCSLPLLSREHVLGVLGLGSSRENAFSEDDFGFLGQVANQIVLVIENAFAYGEISQLKDRLARANVYLESEIRSELHFEDIVGNSISSACWLAETRERHSTSRPRRIAISMTLSPQYGLAPQDYRLQNLSLPARLYARLKRWCEGGQYGHLFDNIEDTIRFSDLTAFEFQGMERALDALRPLSFYLQQRFEAIVYDQSQLKHLKLLVLDECWRSMLLSDIGAYMVERS
jgi:GAF domain